LCSFEIIQIVPKELFDPYNRVSDTDLRRTAQQQQQAYLSSVLETILGTIADFEQKNRSAD